MEKTYDPKMKRTRYSDPAMVQVRACRVSSTGTTLFASEVKHSHYVVLEIDEAVLDHELNHDFVFGHKRIVEVAFSPVQWADLLTSMNTSGTPATLSYSRQVGEDNGRQYEMPEMESQSEVLRREAKDLLGNQFAELKQASDSVKASLAGDKPIGKTEQKALLAKIGRVESALTMAFPFMLDHFKGHMEKMQTEAKASVEAWLDGRIRALGLEAFKNEMKLGMLEKRD